MQDLRFMIQDAGFRMQNSESRSQEIGNFEFRNAKLGTRPKGGSPKDNCGFEKA